MNATIRHIFDQLDMLASEGPDTSGLHDHLSQVLEPEHSGRIQCSRKELEEALTWADHAMTRTDQAEKHASHLKGIMRDMMSMLSMHFGVTDFEDMLVRIPASALALALALAPTPGPAFGDNDDDDDNDVDLGDF
ncbi:hypothetical protein COCNU_scaffold014566G000030 [Cocos nucifera]|nr:hypothetical protein [Cocos nucifera]